MADINDLNKCIKDALEADLSISVDFDQIRSETIDAAAIGSAVLQGLIDELGEDLDDFLKGIPSLAEFGGKVINDAKKSFWGEYNNIVEGIEEIIEGEISKAVGAVCGVTSKVTEFGDKTLTTGLDKLVDHGTVALNESLGNINPKKEIKDIINEKLEDINPYNEISEELNI